jgi:hypothetical protein
VAVRFRASSISQAARCWRSRDANKVPLSHAHAKRLSHVAARSRTLAGDKKATELLEPQNYLDAAERLAGKFALTARSQLKKHIILVVLIVVLFVGGIALLLITPKHAGGTAAGLSAVLAALGLTWKGVGGTLGVLAGKLEAPLWGAELDGAVTDAVTMGSGTPDEEPARPDETGAEAGLREPPCPAGSGRKSGEGVNRRLSARPRLTRGY